MAAAAGHHLRHGGDHHAGARHHDRQRGAALYAGQPFGLARSDQLGADLLYRGLRHHDGPDRLDRGSLRAQEAVHRLHRRLHGRLDAVRPRRQYRRDGGVPPAARRIRRRAGAAVAGGPARFLFGGRARLRHGDLGHRGDARAHHGPDAGRLAHRQLQLALGLLHQSSGRHRHRHRADAVHGGDAAAEAAALRLVRLSGARGRHRSDAADARPRRAIGLVRIARDHRRDGGLDDRLLLLPGAFADQRAAVRPLRHFQGPELCRRLPVHGHHRAGAVRHHGAGDAVHAERARLSDPHRRLPARRARRRHADRHADGGPSHEDHRAALPGAGRDAARDLHARPDGRLHGPDLPAHASWW